MAGANELILFLVPRHCATQVRADGGEHTKLALLVFRNINGFFGYCFPPAIHLLNLNGAHPRFIQSRKLAHWSHGRPLNFSRPAQLWEKRVADASLSEQAAH